MKICKAALARGRRQVRILLRRRPGFYVMRIRRGAPLVPALIFQHCPRVMLQPTRSTAESGIGEASAT